MRVLGALSVIVLVACGDAHEDAPPTAQPEPGGGSSGAASGGPVATTPPACPNGMTDPNASSLVFDGVDDYVTMGAAPALGLDHLTIEAWVRRDGRGKTFGTGVGGLTLVPIAGKGRGEGDGSNVDCNYAFGFVGDVLGADFEDAATGANHPVLGKTAVSLGQ